MNTSRVPSALRFQLFAGTLFEAESLSYLLFVKFPAVSGMQKAIENSNILDVPPIFENMKTGEKINTYIQTKNNENKSYFHWELI